MMIIDVPASSPYLVEIGSGTSALLGSRIRSLCPKAERAVVVSDDTVFPLHGQQVLSAISDVGLEAVPYVLPAGEASKNTDELLKLMDFLTGMPLTRTDVLVALGGGMIGDLAGFAAAVYMRGIAVFQLPTTLLAAIDSSVGGKTAVDLPAGKNLMGAFWQPKAVLCDTEFLKTLPEEIFADGCAEVIKTALLFDPPLFDLLSRTGPDYDREYVIARCVAHKRDVVSVDEFDTGLRGKLNLGHTVGHAVEAESAYTLSHGKSVAIGTAVVCRAAAAAGYCDPWLPDEVTALLKRFGLPIKTDIDLDRLMPVMLSDKKRTGNIVNVIVPRRVGRCDIIPMEPDSLYRFMEGGMLP